MRIPNNDAWISRILRRWSVGIKGSFRPLGEELDERREWLRTAAENGHIPAMHGFARQCSDPGERQRWLCTAAQKGHVTAMNDLRAVPNTPNNGRIDWRDRSHGGHPEDRIRAIFGLAENAALPHVDKMSLRAYYRYLAAYLTFPFPAVDYAEAEPLVPDRALTVETLLDPSNSPVDVDSGLLCQLTSKKGQTTLPLAELKVNGDDRNARMVEDYWYWFWSGHR